MRRGGERADRSLPWFKQREAAPLSAKAFCGLSLCSEANVEPNTVPIYFHVTHTYPSREEIGRRSMTGKFYG